VQHITKEILLDASWTFQGPLYGSSNSSRASVNRADGQDGLKISADAMSQFVTSQEDAETRNVPIVWSGDVPWTDRPSVSSNVCNRRLHRWTFRLLSCLRTADFKAYFKKNELPLSPFASIVRGKE
jgi:hypothetical protein